MVSRLLALLISIPSLVLAEPVVDASSLEGKIVTGYQGWFNCEGDGMDLGWKHWNKTSKQPFGPGNVTIDLWPDVSEYGEDELYDTGFRFADGRVARVFSSADPRTVMRHFEWMRDYGIDGAFLQRFANGIQPESRLLPHKDRVLENVRAAAKATGRIYTVMYDLSGLKSGTVERVQADWARLQPEVTSDGRYLHHEGKPLVAVWGVGFGDDRDYSLQECDDLVDWLKEQGCAVMLGIPTGWRDGSRDATKDPKLKEVLAKADVLSPWTVGRYRNPEEAARHGERYWKPDREWSESREIDYLPVVYPGFSWFNLHGGELGAIPRLKGEFLWSQFLAARDAGCSMVYVAMFDEVDEATAIMKVSDEVPVGEGVTFLDLEGVPSDHYLRLTGAAAAMLRGDRPWSETVPEE